MLILRDPDRASDATQEALIAAWRDLSALRDPGRFDAWVHRVLVRACHTEARRDRRRRTVEIRELPLDHHAAADKLPGFVDRDQLERGFRHLSVEERATSTRVAHLRRVGYDAAVDPWRSYLGILLRPNAT
jgi:DNA-directed RNA polymerase specialized sigma24 family protein